ncbi:hypothetical protein PIROE2DRAFT_2205 [Piromyces sp. E2]|nr:hypothetical protein PIROE2DRAFT_2205 [Piromyces sp. E2]|eukprot:OUM69781.1 hypothetical protein PIROE2DRAFT_2205 [Piromyces sp. E2]
MPIETYAVCLPRNQVSKDDLARYCNLGVLSPIKSVRKRTFRKAIRSRRRKRYGKTINVKEDREGYSKTYLKQKVTKHQQKIINKRFKNGYSPFKDIVEGKFQLSGDIDKCKWVWRTINTLNYVTKLWSVYPFKENAPGTSSESLGNVYACGQDHLDTSNLLYDGTGTIQSTAISDPSAKTITDITLKPIESYPFNIR